MTPRLCLPAIGLLLTAPLSSLAGTPPNVAHSQSDLHTEAAPAPKQNAADSASMTTPVRETRDICGWTVHIDTRLLGRESAALETALNLLRAQLEEIDRVVPPAAVAELRKVPLYFSPEYPNSRPRAEYHPNAKWLREYGRDPVMAKAVEFSNVRIFEPESRRMPNFALHELAHAYHDRVVRMGFANLEIKAAYERAKKSGAYDSVERQDSEGRRRLDKAYALATPQEYFAEASEAYFSRNDFYPFDREQLREHDPDMLALLEKLWSVTSAADPPPP